MVDANQDLLAKGLESQGYKVTKDANGKIKSFSKGDVTGTYDGKKLNFQGTSKVDANAIQKSYSEQIVEKKKQEFKKKGWEVYKEKGEMVFKAPATVKVG